MKALEVVTLKMCIKSYVISNEDDLVQVLDTMYENSKKDNCEFYDLIELMKNEETIISAIHRIKANKGSYTAGIDKKDINKYLQMKADKLIKLIQDTIDDYHPSPVRRVYIPKKNGKMRPLGIPTMLDRIIQMIAKMVIEPIVEAKFFNHSYGFRPYRNAEHAIARVVQIVNTTGCKIAIEGDIEGFFDNVDHNILIKMMYGLGIKDQRFLSIIKKMLRAGIMEELKMYESILGTPQGGIISPILANIYLNCFDNYIAKQFEEHPFIDKYIAKSKSKLKVAKDNARKSLKKQHKPKYLIRYADDWIILTTDIDEAKRVLRQCEKFFKNRLKLNLSKEKTLITDLTEQRAKFLGFEIFIDKKRFSEKEVCKVIPNAKIVRKKVRTILDKMIQIRYMKTEFEKVVIIEQINSMIIGLTNYFRIAIAKKLFMSIDNQIYYTAFKTWKYMGYEFDEAFIELNKLGNLTNRHKDYTTKTFFLEYKDIKVGITKAFITPIQYARLFNPEMTPYSEKGRSIRKQSKSNKQMGKYRNTIYNPYELFRIVGNNEINDKIYNFEYVMNREYAYNRDRWKCVACKKMVNVGNIHCHHKDKKLPMNKINKIYNLITLCNDCHNLVHSDTTTNNKKILELRNILNH